MRAELRTARYLWLILLLGLLLRCGYALAQPTLLQFTLAEGGDSGRYLAMGAGFFSGQEHGRVRGIPFYNTAIPTAPLYIIYVGLLQQFFPDHETIIVLRLLQCLASIATVYLVYRCTTVITRDSRAGLVAAGLAALHPALIMEPANIATETLYIFFLALGLWLYIEYFVDAAQRRISHQLSPKMALTLAALAFALATLTRAIFLLFPLGIALHLLLLGRRRIIGNWRGKCLLLLAVYSALILTWTVYNLVLGNRLIIGSDQFMPAFWRGVESADGSPQENDALLLAGLDTDPTRACEQEVDCKYHHPTEIYVEKIREIIEADLAGLVALRLNELGYSLMQPHGTMPLGNISIRAAAFHWLSESRSVDGLLQVLRLEGFAIKFVVWAFHCGGIVFGLLGIAWFYKSWTLTLPLIGFLAYTIGAHLFLIALPRYLFPIEIIWLIFAGGAIIKLHERWRRRKLGRAQT